MIEFGRVGTARASIRLEDGAYAVICGPCDTGKTNFCLDACGLGDASSSWWTSIDGQPLSAMPESERVRVIAYVPNDPSLLFSGAKKSLSGELELSSILLGTGDTPPPRALADIVDTFKLAPLLDRDPFSLSGGEIARAGVALAVLRRPKLLVIDQAFGSLDPCSLDIVRAGLTRFLPRRSISVEITNRRRPRDRAERIQSVPAWEISLSQRDVRTDCGPPPPPNYRVSEDPLAQTQSPRPPILDVVDLTFAYPRGGFRLSPLDLHLGAGERLILSGPNGAGKTTLLRCLALLLDASWRDFTIRPEHGAGVTPPPRARRHEWARSALYCFQRPDDQLYLPTVKGEVVETARRIGRPDFEDRGLDAADRLGLTPFLSSAPLDLPRPLRRLVPIAAALAAAPPLLLLDEPSACLDDAQVARLVDALTNMSNVGAAVIVTHDGAFASAVGTSQLDMSTGSVRPALAAR